MQWCGSINKSPTKLNAAEIKLTWWFVYEWGKPPRQKPHQVIFRSPLPRIHYYQSQVVTSIRNLTKPFDLSRNTNLQLNSYPNTQLDLYCSGNLPVQCTDPSPWLTPATWRRCWLQSSSVHQQWRSGSSLVTKPNGVKMQSLLFERTRHKVTFCMCDGL